MTFQEFETKYTEAFRKAQKYRPSEIGFLRYTERMAELADEYPEWAEQVEENACLFSQV